MWPFGKRRSLARQGEDLAVKHLRKAGYHVLERNVRLGRCEIDIIAQEGDTVAFVEVKTRREDALNPPEANVTRLKRRNIRRAAHRYIARQPSADAYYRFDVVAVVLPEGGKPKITLFRDAFPDE